MHRMPRLEFAPLVALLLALAPACDALDDFETTVEDVIVIPGMRPAGQPIADVEFGGSFSQLDLSASRGFSEAGASPGDVDSIKLKSGRLQIDLGNPQLNDLSVYVAALTLKVSSDNQESAVVMTVSDFPMAASMDLPVNTTLELKPYAVDTGMRFDAEVTLATQPALPVKLTTTLTLAVDINLLGT